MARVKLYGHLGARFGRKAFDLAVSSPAEAVRALCAVLPGFRVYLAEHSEPGYRILVGDDPQTQDTLHAPCGQQVICLVPVVAGGKDEIMQVLTGAALIALAVWNPMGWAAGSVGLSMLTGIGASMALGGVARMLAPSPEGGAPDSDNAGKYFNGAENTAAQGACIPVAYGEGIIGSVCVSAGTAPETYPTGPAGGPFGANGSTWTQVAVKSGDTTKVWKNDGDGSTAPWVFNVDPAA